MPYSVDRISSNFFGRLQGFQQMSGEMARSLGFSRLYATQTRTARLGTNPAALQPIRLGVTQGGDIRDVWEISFDNIFVDVVASMRMRERTARRLGVQAVTGQLDDVHDYITATVESQLTIELFSTTQNKAVDMFNETVRMQA